MNHMCIALDLISFYVISLQALKRLHQLRILGHSLIVEFAKDQDNVVVLKSPKVSDRYEAEFVVP